MTFIMSVTFIGCELAALTAAGYLVVLVSPDGESPWPDPRVARRGGHPQLE